MEGELATGPQQSSTSGHPSPRGPYRALDRIANVAAVFVIANVVLDIFAVVTDVQMVGLLDRIKSGEAVTFEEADALDVRMFRIGLLQGLGVLIAGIPFVMWFRRAYRNLGALGVRLLRFKPGWAVGAWFVPIMNLARPKSIANDIWRATDPELPADVERPPSSQVSKLLNLLWSAFIVSGILYSSGNRFVERPSLEDLLSEARRFVVADTISVVAGILAIAVIRAITTRMRLRHEAYRAKTAGDPAVPV